MWWSFWVRHSSRYGFSPFAFDARLAENHVETTTFDFGVVGLIPSTLRMFAAHLADELRARHRKAAVAIVEFTPALATLRSRADPGPSGH